MTDLAKEIVVMRLLMTFVALTVLASVSGCRFQRAREASDAQNKLIGMSRHDLLSCAGVPARQEKDGNTEFLTYESGGDSVGVGVASVNGSTATAVGVRQRRYCEVTFVLDDGKVSKVNYTGRTGGLVSRGEQCDFVVVNCMGSR